MVCLLIISVEDALIDILSDHLITVHIHMYMDQVYVHLTPWQWYYDKPLFPYCLKFGQTEDLEPEYSINP